METQDKSRRILSLMFRAIKTYASGSTYGDYFCAIDALSAETGLSIAECSRYVVTGHNGEPSNDSK